MNLENIMLNYRELSHITDISGEAAKQIFCNELGTDKVKVKDFLSAKELKIYFVEPRQKIRQEKPINFFTRNETIKLSEIFKR